MNTTGKILVILNFIFALLVGGFLAIDYTKRTDWKNKADKQSTELDVARANNAALVETNSRLAAERDALRSDLDTKKLDNALLEAKNVAETTDLMNKNKESEQRANNAEIRAKDALAAQDRLVLEVGSLKKVIADREARLVELHDRFKTEQDLRISLDRDLKFSLERNEVLIRRVQELERIIVELTVGKDAGSPLAKDPTAPNPPPKFVKGVVEKVDGVDKSLVRISLGTDHGLKNNHTLEVYRFSPGATYVGLMRIEDAHHHTSIGRLIRTPGAPTPTAREGDVVSSTLTPR